MDLASRTRAVIALNNSSVSLLSTGSYEKAICKLSEALTASKALISDSEGQGSSAASIGMDKCMQEQSTLINENDSDSNGNLFLYQRPICIPCDMPVSYESNLLASVIVIFNLALAHHLTAMGYQKGENQRKRSKLLKKAAKLYELAHKLYHDNESFEESALFIIVCCNNLGLISNELNDAKTAQKYFQHLLSTLMFLATVGDSSVSKFDGFFRNTSHLVFQQATRTAAAAWI